MLKNSKKLQNKKNTHFASIDELWRNEKFLINYNNNLVNKLSKAVKKNSSALEFGAGLGSLSKIWKSKNNVKPECLEIDSRLRKILSDRGFICYKDIDSINKKYDIVYTSNVLEHIDNDLRTLKKINSIIKPNGFLAVYVPAFMFLYNELDLSFGHYRRYEKNELINKVMKANFKIKECYYVDSIGFFAWLFVGLRKYNKQKKLSTNKELKIYDKYLFPLSALFDNLGLRFFFGKNLLLIAQKS